MEDEDNMMKEEKSERRERHHENGCPINQLPYGNSFGVFINEQPPGSTAGHGAKRERERELSPALGNNTRLGSRRITTIMPFLMKQVQQSLRSHDGESSSISSNNSSHGRLRQFFGLQQLFFLTLLAMMIGYSSGDSTTTTAAAANMEEETTTLLHDETSSVDTKKMTMEYRQYPLWQSVISDTATTTTTTTTPATKSKSSSIPTVLPLFGLEGPTWRLDSDDGIYQNVTAQIPGEIISDLMNAGLIDEPYMDQNFLTQRHVWMGNNQTTISSVAVERNIKSSSSTISSLHHDILLKNKDDDDDDDDETEVLHQRSRSWTYSTTFEMDSTSQDDMKWMLVVEGVKMGATVTFNGVVLGHTTNQFLRYIWILNEQDHLSKGTLTTTSSDRRHHELSISFDPTIKVDGRFMACSGGWDWAPYTQEGDSQGRRVFTFGIVQPIYLVPFRHFAMTHVVPKIYYQGKYPRVPMLDGPQADFTVLVDVHLLYPEQLPARGDQSSNSSSSLTEMNTDVWVSSEFDGTQHRTVTTSHPTDPSLGGTVILTFNMTASKDDIKLWWPNGLGDQPMYDIVVGMGDSPYPRTDSMATTWGIRKRVGFRTSALVTTNDTDDTVVAHASTTEGSGQHGMFFRINGAALMAKGANFIPMDQLEGRFSDQAHRIAVQSAAAANMNMFRIWGGGTVLPNAFYDACDENGILLYHDMMFAQEGHSPVRSNIVERELRNIVRSLSSHPSIVLWNGCNECSVVMNTSTEIYASFVMQTVADEDDTRSIWPSSPSKLGWKSGVSTLDSRPNGRPLVTWNPKDYHKTLESHGPYQRSFSNSYPGVNGLDNHLPYENTPPKFDPDIIGPQFSNLFASEFGASVMSSFESMSGTLSSESWGLHGGAPPDTCIHPNWGNYNSCTGNNTMAQRNYPCDSHILAYFGQAISLDCVGKYEFQAQLYLCMMAQTLWMKGEIEKRRSKNSLGLLIWQLNENWSTGGWGAIEYGTHGPGQVVGGRWKPLMHLFESSLYRDVFAACGQDNQCYIRNDGIAAVNASVYLEAWKLPGTQKVTLTHKAQLESFSIDRFFLPSDLHVTYDTVLIRVEDDSDRDTLLMKESTFLFDMPSSMKGLISQPVLISIDAVRAGANGTAVVSLHSDGLALFVCLTTTAQGRFTDNAFALRPMIPQDILFVSLSVNQAVDVDLLRRTVRVEHLGSYLTRPEESTPLNLVEF